MKFFIWSLLEIYLFTQSVDHFGFFASIYFYLAPSLIGVLLISSFQRRMISQSVHLNPHILAQFLGSLLLIVPSVTTRIFALILLLPGLRHIFLLFCAQWILSHLTQNGVFQFNLGGFAYKSKSNSNDRPKEDSQRPSVDGNVIDVTAVNVSDD